MAWYYHTMDVSSRNIWGELSFYDHATLESSGEAFNFGIPGFEFTPIEQVRLLGRCLLSIYELIDAVDLVSTEDFVVFNSIYEFIDHLYLRLNDENARPPFMEPEPTTPPRFSRMRERHRVMLDFVSEHSYDEFSDLSEYSDEELYSPVATRDDIDDFFLRIEDDLDREEN